MASVVLTPDDREVSTQRWRAAPWIAGLAGLAVGLAGIWRPSPWRDEIVSLAVSHRSFGEIGRLAGNVDAVLTPYYWLLHLVTAGNLTGIRAISAVALAGTAACLVWLGRLLGEPRAGALAAGALLVTPTAGRYGQEARPYALAMFLATLAVCLLTAIVLSPPTPTWRDRRDAWWPGYVVTLAALGWTQLVGVVVVVAHAVTVLLLDRARWRRWLAAAAVAAVLVAPLAWFGARQRNAVAWLDAPDVGRLARFPLFLAGNGLWVPWAIVILVGVLFARRTHPPVSLAVALPWLVLPPLALFLLGQATPLYTERYLLVCLPGAALAIGAVLSRTPLPLAVALLALVAAVSLPQHLQIRQADGHGEDFDALLRIVDDRARPGDGVLFDPMDTSTMAEAYPDRFGKLTNVTLPVPAAAAGSLGTGWDPARVPQVPAAVRRHDRVWLIGNPGTIRDHLPVQVALDTLDREYTPAGEWRPGSYQVRLYVRR
jgi:mannosyltransferase